MIPLAAEEEGRELPEYAVPVVRNWLHQNTEVVEVCVFREQWIAPTEDRPKGIMRRFPTITRVHKGTVQVGERVVLSQLVEFSPDGWEREARLRPDQVSMVGRTDGVDVPSRGHSLRGRLLGGRR